MKRAGTVRRTGDERGSALLIVFVFAAIIAISLYMEMPVAAFEAQRQKEELLVERGNEYARAVKLFVRKTGRYPNSVKDLEDTNRMRFLRREYIDPFTGKNDWRLLHAGPGGMIVDSKVNPLGSLGQSGNGSPGQAGAGVPTSSASFGNSGNSASGGGFSNSGGSSFGSGSFSAGSSGQSGSSFGSSSSGSSFGSTFSSASNSSFSSFGASSNSSEPGTAVRPLPQRGPAISASGGAAGQTGINADPDPNGATPPVPPGSDGQAASNGTANGASLRAGTQNGINPAEGQSPEQAGSSGSNPGGAANGLANAGSGAVGTDLKSSMVAATGAPQQQGGNGNTGSFGNSGLGVLQGGGIAGVASKASGHSIKTVNDQANYSLWEFYYDPRKEVGPGLGGAQGGTVAGQTNGGANNANGQQSSFGQSSFGQGSSGQSSFGQSGQSSFGQANGGSSGFNSGSSPGFNSGNRQGSSSGQQGSSFGQGSSQSSFGSGTAGTNQTQGSSNGNGTQEAEPQN